MILYPPCSSIDFHMIIPESWRLNQDSTSLKQETWCPCPHTSKNKLNMHAALTVWTLSCNSRTGPHACLNSRECSHQLFPAPWTSHLSYCLPFPLLSIQWVARFYQDYQGTVLVYLPHLPISTFGNASLPSTPILKPPALPARHRHHICLPPQGIWLL